MKDKDYDFKIGERVRFNKSYDKEMDKLEANRDTFEGIIIEQNDSVVTVKSDDNYIQHIARYWLERVVCLKDGIDKLTSQEN